MKHGSTTSLQSQIGSQLSESHLKQPKTQTSAGMVLSSIFWDVQGILFIDYLEKRRTINSEYYIGAFERNFQKTATNEEEKSSLSPRQCTMSQVNRNDGKTT